MATNTPLNGDYSSLSNKSKEAFPPITKGGDASIYLECKPFTDRQRRAWSQFWDEIIDEAKKDLARTDGAAGLVPGVRKNDDFAIHL